MPEPTNANTTSDSKNRLRKRLSANDLGIGGSHQAGILVPIPLAHFFPKLDEGELNPNIWISIEHDGLRRWRWHFIHYNNKVVRDGTRNEYRLTGTVHAMRALGCQVGSEIELTRTGDHTYQVSVVKNLSSESKTRDPRVVILSTSGPWSSVSVRTL